MSTSANRSPLLIPVDTRNSHVLKHPYRVNLFKVSMSVRLKPLENETIDKKVWCNMMDLFTKTYIQVFGSSDSVFVDYFRYVPNFIAVNGLPIAIDFLYQLCVVGRYTDKTRVMRYYSLGVKPIWEGLHDFDTEVKYGAFKSYMGQRVKDVNLGFETLYDERLVDQADLEEAGFNLDRPDPRLIFDPFLFRKEKYDDIISDSKFSQYIKTFAKK